MPAGANPVPTRADEARQQKEPENETTARTQVGGLSSPQAAKINPSPSLRSQPGVTRNNTKPDRSAAPADLLISLKDGSGEVALDRAGHVTGLSNVPAETREAVREALSARGVKRPQVLNSLYGEGGAMRGAKETGAPFKLLTPERTVVAEDRPLFKWQQLAGATGYQVHVVDASNREVARSAILSPPTSEWRPITPLKRGVVYTWVVTAMVRMASQGQEWGIRQPCLTGRLELMRGSWSAWRALRPGVGRGLLYLRPFDWSAPYHSLHMRDG